jgi:hypothetical protein
MYTVYVHILQEFFMVFFLEDSIRRNIQLHKHVSILMITLSFHRSM